MLVGYNMAQNRSEDVNGLDEKLRRYLEQTMPGWTHERVEPLAKSENVLIQFWSSSNRRVKVSILVHKSTAEAKDVLQQHAKYSSDNESLRDLGDEAYATRSSDVAFRRGSLTIYLTAIANVDADADAQTLTQTQRSDRERSEMRRLSREFAKQVAMAIDSPN